MIYSVAGEGNLEKRQAPIAQSVEHLHGKEKVNGSIPFGGSNEEDPAPPGGVFRTSGHEPGTDS